MHKIIIALSIALTACGSSESDAKKAVLNQLTDPDSAKFGEFTLVNEHGACLAVNAKNKMGGYTGEQQAILMRGDKDRGNEEWQVTDFSKLSHENCVTVIGQVDFSALGDAD